MELTRERLQEIKKTYGLYVKQELIAEIERLEVVVHELRKSRDERLEEVAQKYELQTQQIVAQNEYYLKVIAGEIALQPPPPILIDNVDKVAELEATVEALRAELREKS